MKNLDLDSYCLLPVQDSECFNCFRVKPCESSFGAFLQNLVFALWSLLHLLEEFGSPPEIMSRKKQSRRQLFLSPEQSLCSLTASKQSACLWNSWMQMLGAVSSVTHFRFPSVLSPPSNNELSASQRFSFVVKCSCVGWKPQTGGQILLFQEKELIYAISFF